MNTNHIPNYINSFTGPEKRYLPRWDVNNRVLCRLPDQPDSLECRSMDLSCAGACIVARQSLSKDIRLKLTIYLTEAKSIELEGQIVWSRTSGYGNLIGVNFVNTSQDIQESILKYAFEYKKKDLLNHWFEGWNAEEPMKDKNINETESA
jgi:hypothetical protein